MYNDILDIKNKADEWVKINIDHTKPNPIAHVRVT